MPDISHPLPSPSFFWVYNIVGKGKTLAQDFNVRALK